MMQDLVEATHIAITKAVWIAMFQLFYYWIRRKLNLILKLEVATLNEKNLTFVAYIFVANYVRYISAIYYLNWFSFHTVIMKVLGVNFFWNTVYIYMTGVQNNAVQVWKLNHTVGQQEAQLMLTTGSTPLAVSRGQQTWYHSTCYIWFPIVQ